MFRLLCGLLQAIKVHKYKKIQLKVYFCVLRLRFFGVTIYRVILSVLDPRKCEYLKDYSLDFEPAYMTTYLAS